MIEFLKCDNADCGSQHDVAEITEAMIGTQCPDCGSDMLTREDWEFYATVFRPSLDLLIALGITSPADAETPEHQRLAINGHNREVRFKFPSPPTT